MLQASIYSRACLLKRQWFPIVRTSSGSRDALPHWLAKLAPWSFFRHTETLIATLVQKATPNLFDALTSNLRMTLQSPLNLEAKKASMGWYWSKRSFLLHEVCLKTHQMLQTSFKNNVPALIFLAFQCIIRFVCLIVDQWSPSPNRFTACPLLSLSIPCLPHQPPLW